MGNHVVSYQSPRPEVVIWKPDKSGTPLRFDTANKTLLQSYSFGTSINDEKGKFSLTFYPGNEVNDFGDIGLNDDNGKSILDNISVMDIVQIFESNNHFVQSTSLGQGSSSANSPMPTFTGVIREKKYVAQIAENGVTRKVVISGHSIVGLVQEFRINLDMQATTITAELANNKEIQNEFTIKFIQSDNSTLSLEYVIKEIWKSFINLSSQYQKSSNPKIVEYIKTWIGSETDIFEVDDSKFHYPLGSVFKGQTTQSFFEVISHLVPKPVYEIFPHTERSTGKMRLIIREVQFDPSAWNGLDKKTIDPNHVKSFDVKQNNNEIYTVFFSYLNGFPIQEDKAIILAAQGVSDMPGLEIDQDNFPVYGYRPLFASFNGYGRADGVDDTDTAAKLQKLNLRLKDWFSKKEKKYSGTITMETNLLEDMPQAGEKIQFLGGEFYVVDSEHNWNYGGAPEAKISLDRGGDYSDGGVFAELKNMTLRYQEFEKTIGRQS